MIVTNVDRLVASSGRRWRHVALPGEVLTPRDDVAACHQRRREGPSSGDLHGLTVRDGAGDGVGRAEVVPPLDDLAVRQECDRDLAAVDQRVLQSGRRFRRWVGRRDAASSCVDPTV